MGFSRRGIFGLFAAAPAAVVAARASEPEPAPEYFVGQIRSALSHYETQVRPLASLNHTHQISHPGLSHTHPLWLSPGGYFTESVPVAVHRYEQWNGKEWMPIGEPRP